MHSGEYVIQFSHFAGGDYPNGRCDLNNLKTSRLGKSSWQPLFLNTELAENRSLYSAPIKYTFPNKSISLEFICIVFSPVDAYPG